MFNRIRFLANYASLRQLYAALTADAAIATSTLGIAMLLIYHHHPRFAIPFQIASGFESILVGIAIYLIRKRYTTARS